MRFSTGIRPIRHVVLVLVLVLVLDCRERISRSVAQNWLAGSIPAQARSSNESDHSRLKIASVLPTRMMSPGSRVFFGTLWPLT